jgi:hypothetical protein
MGREGAAVTAREVANIPAWFWCALLGAGILAVAAIVVSVREIMARRRAKK